MYKCVLVRICLCSLQHALACYRLGLVYLVQQGQQTVQDLAYVTVDLSQPRPINAPNENWMSSTQVLNLTLKLLQYNSKW